MALSITHFNIDRRSRLVATIDPNMGYGHTVRVVEVDIEGYRTGAEVSFTARTREQADALARAIAGLAPTNAPQIVPVA